MWISHILVRHNGSRSSSVSFDHAHWQSGESPPARSREAALAIANDIAQRAQQDPSQFASLARQHSEDLTTRDRGGAFGGVAADQLRAWPAVLDAMSALRPGEISRVVETVFGFHIFLRSAPPPETEASGFHIVIAHDDAQWIRFVARGTVPKRTRAEAWQLAHSLYERAKASPASFAQLVREHSDHRDAARGGDFGTWSNHAPTPFPRELQALQGLELGEIAPPLDTRVGIQIIQRRAPSVRSQYAMTAVHLPFQADAHAANERSREAVAKQASDLRKRINDAPELLAKAQAEYCCATVEQWEDGRGPPVAANVLDQLRPGEMAAEPIEQGSEWLIIKRLSPTPREWPPTRFELPSAAATNAAPSSTAAHGKACSPSQPFISKLAGS